MPQPPTITALAEAAGVAKSTVSLALRDSPKVVEATRLRIKNLALELGYRPNPLVSAQMSHIRHTRKRQTATTIGFLSTWFDEARGERQRWSIMGRYFDGAKRRAEELGIGLELFDFDRVRYTDARIQQILYSRNIDGLVLAPLKNAQSAFSLNWDQFALAAIGYYNAYGNIHRVFHDNFSCMQSVLKLLIQRGYRRIGFVTNGETEARSGHLWSGGFLEFQSRCIAERNRVPLLRQQNPESLFETEDYERIHDWYLAHKPDVIISFLDNTLAFLISRGYQPNRDFGYVALSWSNEMDGCAGYRQNLETVGATAVEMVAESLYSNERGLPSRPNTVLLTGEFVEGNTLRPSFG